MLFPQITAPELLQKTADLAAEMGGVPELDL